MKRLLSSILACLIAILVSGVPLSVLADQAPSIARQAAAPVFSFPTNGTSYPSNGPYVFQLQPVSGAKGYLWSFVQNGMVVYQNLAWDGHLSPANYTVSTGSKAHSLIHSGDLHVWVRALMKNGRWSATGAVLVRVQGKGRPHTSPTPRPTGPTATPKPTTPQAGQVLYNADWSSGHAGWSLPPGWDTVSGQLVNDGTNWNWALLAEPPKMTAYTGNYAVQAEIQLVRLQDRNCGGLPSDFGIALRGDNVGFYGLGVYANTDLSNAIAFIHDTGWNDGCPNSAGLQQTNTTIDTDWHTYRAEVRGNDIRLLIDGNVVVETTDNHHLRGNTVGLFNHWC